MKRESLVAGFLSVLVISLVAVGSLSLAIRYKPLIGPTLLMLGLLSLIPLRLFGRSIKSCSADIVFGAGFESQRVRHSTRNFQKP